MYICASVYLNNANYWIRPNNVANSILWIQCSYLWCVWKRY